MGLPLGVLQLLALEHSRRPIVGPALTLGEQDVYATYDQVRALLAHYGAPVHDVPPAERLRPRSVLLKILDLENQGYVHARTLFRLLGISDYQSLDASPVEGAALVHDLNTPVPQEWCGRYGFVLDGGTLEHLFDIRTALFNVARLARVAGTVMHISPVANWINHGFFQISPCLLFDFYAQNGFEPGDAYFVVLEPLKDDAPVRTKEIIPYRHSLATYVCYVSNPVLLVTSFQKRREVEPLQVPTQGKYVARIHRQKSA